MTETWQALTGNMSEIANFINQSSANIEGVKGQIINQSSSVAEISATMEEIIRTSHNLNKSIETQTSIISN